VQQGLRQPRLCSISKIHVGFHNATLGPGACDLRRVDTGSIELAP
jgi:hypothetical protein